MTTQTPPNVFTELARWDILITASLSIAAIMAGVLAFITHENNPIVGSLLYTACSFFAATSITIVVDKLRNDAERAQGLEAYARLTANLESTARDLQQSQLRNVNLTAQYERPRSHPRSSAACFGMEIFYLLLTPLQPPHDLVLMRSKIFSCASIVESLYSEKQRSIIDIETTYKMMSRIIRYGWGRGYEGAFGFGFDIRRLIDLADDCSETSLTEIQQVRGRIEAEARRLSDDAAVLASFTFVLDNLPSIPRECRRPTIAACSFCLTYDGVAVSDQDVRLLFSATANSIRSQWIADDKFEMLLTDFEKVTEIANFDLWRLLNYEVMPL